MLTSKVGGDKVKEASFGILQIPVKDNPLRFPFCLDFVIFDKMDLVILVTDEENCSFVYFFSQV